MGGLRVDPNSGTTFYGYSPYGKLNYSKDANDRIFTFAYDTLGRMTNRYEEYFNTQWQYNSKGTLERLSSTNGYAQIYDYDDLLRPESVTDSIGSQELTTAYSYDENGRVSEVAYPGGFGVTYTYQNSDLKEIHRSDNDDLIWKLNDVTAKGEITSASIGNSLSTTKTYNNKGQLLSIQTGYNDSIQDLEYSLPQK